MKGRLSLALAVLAACVVAAGVTPSFASACDTNFWNLGCQFYSPSEGHTGTQFCCSRNEVVQATFDTYDTVLVIATTSGGTWKGSTTICYNCANDFLDLNSSDKAGCYNHHTGTMFVNCRHADG
jgi:hypothetical protein